MVVKIMSRTCVPFVLACNFIEVLVSVEDR